MIFVYLITIITNQGILWSTRPIRHTGDLVLYHQSSVTCWYWHTRLLSKGWSKRKAWLKFLVIFVCGHLFSYIKFILLFLRTVTPGSNHRLVRIVIAHVCDNVIINKLPLTVIEHFSELTNITRETWWKSFLSPWVEHICSNLFAIALFHLFTGCPLLQKELNWINTKNGQIGGWATERDFKVYIANNVVRPRRIFELLISRLSNGIKTLRSKSRGVNHCVYTMIWWEAFSTSILIKHDFKRMCVAVMAPEQPSDTFQLNITRYTVLHGSH